MVIRMGQGDGSMIRHGLIVYNEQIFCPRPARSESPCPLLQVWQLRPVPSTWSPRGLIPGWKPEFLERSFLILAA